MINKEVFIIAGGNSVENINKEKLANKDLIVINKSILDFPNAKYFITMDHSFLNKVDKIYKVIKEFNGSTFFVANLVPEYIEEQGGKIIDTRWNIVYDLKIFDVIIKSRYAEGIGFHWKDFCNCSHSGYCALQLAILLGYKKINLVGYDLTVDGYEKTHYHGGYNQNKGEFNKKLELYFQIYEDTFRDLLLNNEQLKIYNCSPISKLKKILPYKKI